MLLGFSTANFGPLLSKQNSLTNLILLQFRMGLFGAAHRWRGEWKGPLPQICHTYWTIMKLGIIILYLKEIPKLHKSCDTPWVLWTSGNQHWKSTIFLISGNTNKKHSVLIICTYYFFFFTIFESTKVALVH